MLGVVWVVCSFPPTLSGPDPAAPPVALTEPLAPHLVTGLLTWSPQAKEREKGAQPWGQGKKSPQQHHLPAPGCPSARWSQRFRGLFIRDGEGK